MRSPLIARAPLRDGPPVAADDDDIVATVEQLAGDVGPDLAGAEYHVVAHSAPRWRRWASAIGRTDVQAVTTRAPLAPKLVYCASTSMPADGR